LIKVAEVLSQQIQPGEKFNLVAVYKAADRFDRNAVDYRYFLEAKFGVKVPGWDVLDYQNAETLYIISEIGKLDPLKTNIWEVNLFSPKKATGAWELSNDVVIYKLSKE
jgi:hypothetical protein